MRRDASITREIQMGGAYGERQIIVEFNVELEIWYPNATDNFPVRKKTGISDYEVRDENGKDITDQVAPDQIDWLERELWDSL